jgi:FkbM family methyltransferase
MQSTPAPIAGAGISFRHGKKSFVLPRSVSADYIIGQVEKHGSFYERPLLMALAARATRGSIAIDCGANVGNHALFFAGVMGLTVHAFEPVARNRALLEQTVALNGLEARVQVLPVALSDRVGEVALETPDPGNPGMFRISTQGETARTETLDGYLQGAAIDPADIALIKIDVEGHEVQLLQGAVATLARTGAVVTAETATMAEFDAVSAVLASAGYQPTAVYCATPTVLYEKHATAAAGVREAIAAHEAKQARRQT